ncbi:hypothetical protein MKW92_035000 [Papaver armeniacum]|nr:hypothetical protein MKW92_035000 [Papaver armeniacum]
MANLIPYLNFLLSPILSVHILMSMNLQDRNKIQQSIVLMVLSIYNIISFKSASILDFIKTGERNFKKYVSEEKDYLITMMVMTVIEVLCDLRFANEKLMVISCLVGTQILINCWYFKKDISGIVNGFIIACVGASVRNYFRKDAEMLHFLLPFAVFVLALATKIREFLIQSPTVAAEDEEPKHDDDTQ